MVSLAADHEVGDEVQGSVLRDGLDGLDFAVDDDGVGFGAVEVECAEGDAVGAEALGGVVLEAELGGEGGVVEFGFGADVFSQGDGAGLVLKPCAGCRIRKLGLVADHGGDRWRGGWGRLMRRL